MTYQSHIDDPTVERVIYEICIDAHLGMRWAGQLSGLEMSLQADGTTLLTGPVVDQAALYGLLRKIRDFGLPLRSLRRIDQNALEDGSTNNQDKNSENAKVF